ncbi:flagellar hook-basal body complex subunit FliE [Thermovibrio ammonificans HB-1]|uniref:Flagellar hook-basal body complex protein FliE n=1 Tax=Thermovibrio ammonificans (strain DSM 15698 / JCM 12110 / HB-1) TaxID=648996 RepID=E8T484_THEA1|nr:flagellar hook-basal body complex protein FliE [Thermovibrio ammonificans]ADU97413.1 flagellar hook-basal body complex subunit FliE [Thermovibrio ammonificans HB-1]
MKVEFNSSFNLLPLSREKKQESSGFEELLTNFIASVNADQLKAREVEKALSRGEVKNLEEAVLTIEKADLSLRLLVELRNKALESYQEIMRMQV